MYMFCNMYLCVYVYMLNLWSKTVNLPMYSCMGGHIIFSMLLFNHSFMGHQCALNCVLKNSMRFSSVLNLEFNHILCVPPDLCCLLLPNMVIHP